MLAQCRVCGDPFRLESLRLHYERISKSPIYFYTIPLGILALILLGVGLSIRGSWERRFLIEHPAVGHIYRVPEEQDGKTVYSYLKLVAMTGDNVTLYPDTLRYERARHDLDTRDTLVATEAVRITKAQLRQMYDDDKLAPLQ